MNNAVAEVGGNVKKGAFACLTISALPVNERILMWLLGCARTDAEDEMVSSMLRCCTESDSEPHTSDGFNSQMGGGADERCR